MRCATSTPLVELAKVELECLLGEQVRGNRIAAEGVEHDHVETPVRQLAQRRSARLLERFRLALRIANEVEVARLGSGPNDGGIDFEKRVMLSGQTVGGQAARAEADEPDSQVGLDPRPLLKNLGDGAGSTVIDQRFSVAGLPGGYSEPCTVMPCTRL